MQMLEDEKNPPGSDDSFKQQIMPACHNFVAVVPCAVFCVLIGTIFIAIGIPLMGLESQKQEVRYDNVCANATCQINMTLEHDMDSPVFMYYKIKGMYQNHLNYVRSKNEQQLKGENVEREILKDTCDPAYKNAQGKIYYPCGSAASAHFNDTFAGFMRCERGTTTCSSVALTQDDSILFGWDKEQFKNRTIRLAEETPDGKYGYPLPPFVDHIPFIVWMRNARSTEFSKIYGKFEGQDFKQGDEVKLTVNSNYMPHTRDGKGEKYVVLATMTGLGGDLDTMGVEFLVCGIISFVIGIILTILHFVAAREPGDFDYLVGK